MSSRVSIVAGVVAGVVAAAVLLGGIIAFAPEPGQAATPIPSASAASVPPGTETPAPLASATPEASPGTSTPPTAGDGLFGIGQPAPALLVPQVGGGTIDLAALLGQPVWVNFMATWCPPCRDEFPLMNGFAARYADDGLIVLAIDVREDEGTVAAFAAELNPIFPLGLDTDGSAQDRWRALVLPVHFWIDREGIVRDGALGGIGADLMASGVSAILPGVDVEP
jgi:thiol-disulfide isomerase/thioredoxin